MSHFELTESTQRELTKSPHYEFDSGTAPVFTIGTYTVLVDAAWPGHAAYIASGGPGDPCYLAITFRAASAAGGSREFTVTMDPFNGTLSTDTVTNAGGVAPDDINVAAVFGSLFTSGTATSSTVLGYDDGLGNVASATLSSAFTLSGLRSNAHSLLNAVGFSPAHTDEYAQANYASGVVLTNEVPTLYTPSIGVYLWGWGPGGLVSGSPPTTYGHVVPNIVVTYPGVAFIVGESSYLQYSGWHMAKSMIVNSAPATFYFQDDFTATDPGPPSETTPQFPVISGGATYTVTPIGTILDIAAKTTEGNYSAVRSFLHY